MFSSMRNSYTWLRYEEQIAYLLIGRKVELSLKYKRV